MQEPGFVVPEGESQTENPSAAALWASQNVSSDTRAPVDDNAAATGDPASAEDSSARSAAPASRRPQRTADPVVQRLTLGIAFVFIFWLVALLSAMMFGLLSPAQAPRTSAERDLQQLGAKAQSGKANTQTYAQYVGVLISAGQLSKAQQALDQALKTAKTDKSYLYAQQARLFLAQKDYAGAIAEGDKAIAEAKAELQTFKDNNVKNNRKAEAGAVMPTSNADAALTKAEALVASKDYAGAIKAYDVYLAQQPTDSDVLVARGLAQVQVGDQKAAEADFRAALKFIPDYQPALDGLKQIGATQ